MGTRVDVVVEGVQGAYGERGVHRGFDLLFGHPTDFASFSSWMGVTSGRTATVDKGDDSLGEVLVDAGETFDRDLQAGFLEDFASDTVLEGFSQFKNATRGLPVTVVISPDHENSVIVAYDNAGDADRVFRHGCHCVSIFSMPARVTQVDSFPRLVV